MQRTHLVIIPQLQCIMEHMNDSTCNLHDIIVNLCKGRLVCKFAKNNISTKLVFLCGVLSNISPSSGTDIIKFLLILLNNKKNLSQVEKY